MVATSSALRGEPCKQPTMNTLHPVLGWMQVATVGGSLSRLSALLTTNETRPPPCANFSRGFLVPISGNRDPARAQACGAPRRGAQSERTDALARAMAAPSALSVCGIH
eukprot:7309019-Pyramimonas_sp.AAC.3